MSKAEEKFIEELNKEHEIILGFQEYEKKIADLEAKFAESEKQRQHLKDWLDNEILTSVDHESYYATINEYEEEVKKLKQQLADKDKEKIEYTDTINFVETSEPDIVAKELDRLNEQLAEKDADIIALDTDNYSFKRQIDNLRQQLKSQPKEIVEKIRNICCVEDKCEDGSFILGINEKDLDTILKEYQK